jgi:16S rRNA (adenine1518-N6/adenine1519-N6)-dimethyltransferase
MSESPQGRPAHPRRRTTKDGRRAWVPDPGRHTRLNPSRAVKDVLRQHGLRPRKAFGQNFLIDPFVVDQILGAADLVGEDRVVEVGPGLGVLTVPLADRVSEVVAIELDANLIAALRTALGARSNVEIIEADALTVPPNSLFDGAPYKVVANLPYYITSPLLRHFFESDHPPTTLVVMVQREVAERMTAAPGRLSLLGISIQFYCRPRVIGYVPASAFLPMPDVDSAIVRLDVLPSPAEDVPVEPFFKVVSAGFATPRKQLHNSIPQRMWLPPGAIEVVLADLGIDGSRRAQTLTIAEWATLTRTLLDRGLLKP